jgi:hypothetical protein
MWFYMDNQRPSHIPTVEEKMGRPSIQPLVRKRIIVAKPFVLPTPENNLHQHDIEIHTNHN